MKQNASFNQQAKQYEQNLQIIVLIVLQIFKSAQVTTTPL